MNKIEWNARISAPSLYPAELYSGMLYSGKNFATLPSGGVLEDGWGSLGKSMDSGNFVPDSLSVTWLSFVENKFYTGTFKLPTDFMTSLFNKGVLHRHTSKVEPFNSISVSLAPGGVVSVWMRSSAKRQVEVGRFQASETEVDWELFNPYGEQDREVYVKAILDDNPEIAKNIEKNGIQFGLYDTYRTRYSWRPVVELSQGGQAGGIETHYFNGEHDFLWGESLLKNPYSKRALPTDMGLQWHTGEGQRYGAEVKFDEEELFKAFEEFYKEDQDQQAELVLKLNQQQTGFNVFLRNQTHEYELRKVKSGTYKRTP